MTRPWTVIWKRSVVHGTIAAAVNDALGKGDPVTPITNAMNEIDRQLSTRPDLVGESRAGSDRVLCESPLSVTYEVHEEEHVVLVFAARYAPRRT